MAIPTFIDAGTGATDAGGVWAYTCQASAGAGSFFIVQILLDGTTNQGLVTAGTNIEDLAGTDNIWEPIVGSSSAIGIRQVGSPSAAMQYIWCGRALSTSAPTISGTNSTSEDLYIRSYQFSDVNTGTLMTDVREGLAGGQGTSTTVADTGVTTSGSDRLALNFIAIGDDLSGLTEFTGETGGNWTNFQIYESASGTDGTVAMVTADMASAGTINGGSSTIASMAWGVIGFALIGTPPAAPFIQLRDPWPALQAVNRSNTY